jgi:hypothetical protein
MGLAGGLRVRLLAAVVIACSVLVGVPLAGVQPAWAATTKNLIKNGTADKAAGGTGGVVAVPSWTETNGATFTAVQYGAGGGFPDATSPGPKNRGANFFAGGPGDASNDIVAVQTVKLKAYAVAIAGGAVTFKLQAYLGGFLSQNDQASVEIDFKDKHGVLVGEGATIGPVTATDRNNVTGLLKRSASGSVPATAATVFVQLILTRTSGTYNDAYADSLSLTLTGV